MPQPPQTPIIERFVLGPFETNCYTIADPAAQGRWIVDAGMAPGEMVSRLREQGDPVRDIVLTHAHADHIAGLDEIANAFPDAKIHIHPLERPWLTDPGLNLSAFAGQPLSCATQAPNDLADDQTLELLGRPWRVMHTPGHSPGGVTLYLEPNGEDNPGVAFVGDTLFCSSIGRSDFPTSDETALHRAIRERLYTLPDDTLVLPGHGPPTTIGQEKHTNPFVRV